MTRVVPSTRLRTVVGSAAPSLEKHLGLVTVEDLLHHHPRRFVRKGELSRLQDVQVGDHVTVLGEVVGSEVRTYRDRRTGRQAARVQATVAVEGARLDLTFFARHPGQAQWRAAQLRPGLVGLFAGRLGEFRGTLQITHPECQVYADQEDAERGHDLAPPMVPVYPASAAVQSWSVAKAVAHVLDLLDDWPEPVPAPVRAEHDLPTAHQALLQVHRPEDDVQLEAGRRYWRFEEAFVAQVVLARRRVAARAERTVPRVGVADGLLDRFDARLPFTLTAGQRRVGEEVFADLAEEHPMQRLLQGEVGSGKTLVALRAMLRVVDAGGQAALLAPTEVLAQQHHRSITAALGPLADAGMLGGDEHATRVRLLTGSVPAAERREALLDAASGAAGIVVGTHALLEDTVSFAELGLVVVDEQHRFGVEQRARLTAKSEAPPHLLVMTATPIPRTVAMTVFGDLETSVLDELPAGRAGTSTAVVPALLGAAGGDIARERVREEVAQGRRAFVLCPAIEPDPASAPGLPAPDPFAAGPDGVRAPLAVEAVEPWLAAGPLAGLRLGRLHGRMRPEEKDAAMRAFAGGDLDVLVCTTVVEVGVDVPEATVMVVLDADRFGLSQLHQIRGRVGRGDLPGVCLLVTRCGADDPALARLQELAATTDGFAVADLDLRTRREGDVLGTDQSGGVTGLRHLSVVRDEEEIVLARGAAADWLAQDPLLDRCSDLAEAAAALDRASGDYLERG